MLVRCSRPLLGLVCRTSVSSGSTLPPGKATCPEWVDMWLARRVSNTMGSSRMTKPNNTAARDMGRSR